MSKKTKKNIKDKKAEAYDLLRQIYANVDKTKRLQKELAQVESEINELENKDDNP